MGNQKIVVLMTLALVLAGSLSTVPGQQASRAEPEILALVGGRVYPSPVDEPINNGVVVTQGGKIIAVGTGAIVSIPNRAKVIDCTGLVVLAGFWNSHVHFTEDKWKNAASMPAEQLTNQLREMLTRYGVTTVFDTGSYWEITKSIRQRIESGSAQGPTIFTTGEILFPRGASFGNMPQIENAEQGVTAVRRKVDAGVDAIKIYAQAFWDLTLKMPLDAIKAITAEAHRHGKLVFVHPSNKYGLEAAIDSGVDVLVHTTPQTDQWSDALISKMKRGNISLIPTLKLWRIELEKDGSPPAAIQRFQDRGVDQLRAYFKAGGQVLFGTDIGYITDYDPTEEYQQMQRAGMSFKDILASLTTSPASRFGEGKRAGRVVRGMDADLVVLAGDPETDIGALSNVRYTLRGGKVIYRAK
jgi:imidazolonepropionase-like amidohydrolase